ncbi:N-glycosidase [Lachnellula arida]|uniref:N-glycosidase n=1 Tax=Lachnellula arida TaxID=1316785 RepID=A0A8T9BL68_9HELO|nr:N-glycosidase [Lachnellula arida]
MVHNFMVYIKALVFQDFESMEQIKAASTPAQAHALGRKIKGFSDERWDFYKLKAVCDANYMKFTSNEFLKGKLLGTGWRTLVQASPGDRVWGIGYGAEDAEGNRSNWGTNYLGQILMHVRRRIRNEQAGLEKALYVEEYC